MSQVYGNIHVSTALMGAKITARFFISFLKALTAVLLAVWKSSESRPKVSSTLSVLAASVVLCRSDPLPANPIILEYQVPCVYSHVLKYCTIACAATSYARIDLDVSHYAQA
jgi:hypothetical protein